MQFSPFLAIKNWSLIQRMSIPKLVINTRPFSSEIRDRKLRRSNFVQYSLRSDIGMFNFVRPNCCYTKFFETFFITVLNILQLWVSFINLHHDKCGIWTIFSNVRDLGGDNCFSNVFGTGSNEIQFSLNILDTVDKIFLPLKRICVPFKLGSWHNTAELIFIRDNIGFSILILFQ